MRFVGLLVSLCLAFGCKGKGDGAAAPDPEAVKKQQELVARRDALMAARQKLQSERDKIDADIRDAQAKGADTSELVKKKAELDTQIETQTSDLISTMQSGFASIQATTDKSAQLAGREAEVASRERGFASREEKLAAREAAIAQREAALAQREKETCGASTPVIIQQAPPKGGNYSRKDITDILAKAKSAMARRGILTGDLPGPAQSLDSEAGKALADNDLTKAYVYAAQLGQYVDAIKIDRAFIQQKLSRLSTAAKAAKIDDQTLQPILSDVMQKYSDGNFPSANSRLNQLAAKL